MLFNNLLIPALLFLVFTGIMSYFLNGYIFSVFSNNKIIDPITSRSSHRSKATRSGGLSVFLAICISLALAASTTVLELKPYAFLAILFMALTGVADDFFNVRYREKFFLQIFAGIVLLQSGYSINNFHGVFGIFIIPEWLSIMVTLFVFLIVVNAINLIDGLDGLASLVSIKFLIVTGGIILVNYSELFLFFPIIIGGLLGFLLHNFSSTKKVFLGDTGSLFIGATMAFFVVFILDGNSQIMTDKYISRPLMCVLILLYPLTDTLRAIILRSYKNQSPFVADRIHLHHRLVDKGYEHWAASSIIFLISGLILFINLLLFQYIGLILCVAITLILMIVFYYTLFK